MSFVGIGMIKIPEDPYDMCHEICEICDMWGGYHNVEIHETAGIKVGFRSPHSLD